MIEENKSDITKEEAEALKRKLRSLMIAKGFTIEKVANALKEKYGVRESKSNLSNKLGRGSLRFIDVQRICEILGYTITFSPIEEKEKVFDPYR
ncbi:MAG: DUF6471 domain-containing protein [Candidatus Gastranaerophilales bacterium]|nr:DUF6471 domain-containing protein [Candidatus Gastranaerophilales bacterium]